MRIGPLLYIMLYDIKEYLLSKREDENWQQL